MNINIESQTQQKPHEQFIWAVQRVAQMQGNSVDVLSLTAAAGALDKAAKPLQALSQICQYMGLDKPKFLKVPDRIRLPLLCYTEALGWGVVVDQTPLKEWVVLTPLGPKPVAQALLENACCWVKLGPSFELGFGFGFFKRQDEKFTFFAHVQDALSMFKHEILEACIASAFIGMLALATSLFSMQVYDRVIPTRSEYTLVILSLGVFLSIMIELAMKFARSHIMDYVVVGLDSRLSREIFNRLLLLRVDQIPASVGSLAGQMRGYEQVRGFYTASTLFTLIDLPLALVFLVVIMFVASPWVAVVPFIFGLIALLIGVSIRKKIMLCAKDGAALSNMKTGLLVEAVEGIETIKAGSGGWKFLSRWVGVNGKTIESDLKMRGASESVGYLSATIQQVSYAGLVVAGALVVMQGHMTMGALIASSILSGRILAPIMAVPGLLVQHAHAQAALDGLEKLYLLKVDNHGVDQPLVPSALKGHYALSDVKFAYGDNPPALVVPKLEIQPHERIVVLGPIGAGKSTLLRLLSGMYQNQEGRILLDGLDLSHISRQVLSQHIGYLQQDHRLFQGTLRENLLIGLPDPGDAALLDVMKQTGMDRFVASHPKGMARPIMEGGKGLSGGQKQLMAFTRLILCNPEILLLDEPTATMDDEQERRCLGVLAQQAQASKTMVMVTHKSSLLPLATRIMVIVGNSIVMDGPRDEVLQQLQQRSAQQQQQAAATAAAASEKQEAS
jgi:ATP-binding cassette subfamily C protein LapB